MACPLVRSAHRNIGPLLLAFGLAAAAVHGQSVPPPVVDSGAMERQIGELLERLAGEVGARPSDPGAWLAYGESLQAHGLVVEAAVCFRRAAALSRAGEGTGLAARYLLAHAVRGSAPAEAAEVLEAALAAHPGYAPAHVLLGEVREELGDRTGAGAAFERAIQLDAESGLALFRLGALRLADGEPRAAIPLLEGALAAEPGAGAVRATLAQAWNRAGDRERAREVIRLGGDGAGDGLPGIEDPIHFRMTERDISSPRLLERARAARQAGRFAEAERRYRDLARIRSRDPIVLAEFGAVLDRWGRPGEAEPLYRDAIALDPDQALARFGLGALRAREGDLAAAEFQFRASVAARPEEAKAHTALGDVLLRGRRFEEALTALERATRLDPQDGAARLLAGVALAELGRFAAAWEAVHEARGLGVDAPENFLAALRAKHPEPVR